MRYLFVQFFLTNIAAAEDKHPLPKIKHMIGTHIHLYDTEREDGVPWPIETDKVFAKIDNLMSV